MNRLSLTVGLALMDVCWVYPWSVLIGLSSDPAQPRPLLSAISVFGVVIVGALSSQTLGRRALTSRAMRLGLAVLGMLLALIVVRQDQYSSLNGLDWLARIALALAAFLGQVSAPVVAFALGLFLWWRGIRLGSQMPTYSDVENRFRWGIGLLVGMALIMAIAVRPAQLPALEAQTTPFVVAFFFVGLITLALARLESLRTRTRALSLNTQWLGVLIGVAGLVVLLALIVGQLVSFDLLILATRPLFDVLGQVLLLALYIVIIPLAFVVEWLVYLLLSLLQADPNRQPPQPPQPGQVDDLLQRVLAQTISPELLQALKAGGAAVLLIVALLIVARAASRWRSSSADADAAAEERDSLWDSARVLRALRAWLMALLGRGRKPVADGVTTAQFGATLGQAAHISTVRELYRQLLRLGESAGVRRPLATTPLEHLPTLQDLLEPGDDVARLTHAYLAARYAEAEAAPAEVATMRDQLTHVHRRETLDPSGPAQ